MKSSAEVCDRVLQFLKRHFDMWHLPKSNDRQGAEATGRKLLLRVIVQ